MFSRFFSTFILAIFLAACAEQRPSQEMSLQSNPDGIVGGEEVAIGDAKSLSVVMIYGEKESGESFICTGTFISKRVVLTAAHCIAENIATMSVLFGIQPFKGDSVNLEIKSTKKHERYNSGTKEDRNDIALIYLNEDIPATAKISFTPVNVNEAVPSILESYGYGRTEGREDSQNFSDDLGTLRKVSFAGSNLSVYADDNKLLELDQSGGHGVCFGDSGGPLFSLNGQVVGVAAGVESDENGSDACAYKAFFTRVVSYRDWIITNINHP